MTDKYIYIKIIGNKIDVKDNYGLERAKPLTDTEKYALIGVELGKLIGIDKGKSRIDFFDDLKTNFSYSDNIHRTIFSTRKKDKPDKVYIDIIELQGLQDMIKNKLEETIDIIKEEAINNTFYLDILESVKTINNFPDPIDSLYLSLERTVKNQRSCNEKIKLLYQFFLLDKKLLRDFYNIHFKEFHEEIKNKAAEINRDNNKLIMDSNIYEYKGLRENYTNNDFEKIKLIHGNQESFKIDFLFTQSIEECSTDLTLDFINCLKNNRQKVNTSIIFGSEGSGKGQLALALCIGASQENYLRFFINLSYPDETKEIVDIISYALKTKPLKPFFIAVHSLHNISEEDFKNVYSLLKKILINPDNIVIFTSEEDTINSILDKSILKEAYRFDIAKYQSKNTPSFVDNLHLRLIYDQSKQKSQTRGELIYEYIGDILKKISYSKNYLKSDLVNELESVAYKVFLGETVLENSTDNDFRNRLNKLKQIIYYDQDKKGRISFIAPIFMEYLVAEYILKNSQDKINLIKGYKWFSVSSFIGENLAGSFSTIENNQELTAIVINHLRQTKDDKLFNEIVSLILQHLDQINNPDLLLEIAKNYYYKVDYESSIEIALNIPNNKNLKSHLASCFLDLYMPEYSLYFIGDNELKDPRIMGTQARALLKMGKVAGAQQLFKKKLEVHQSKEDKIDILRDKSDLLFVNSFLKKDALDNRIIDNFNEIINGYDQYYQENDKSQDNNIAFASYNLSYYLPYSNKTQGEEIIEKIEANFGKINKASIKHIFVHYYLNLAKYYLKHDKKKSIEIFLKSIDLAEDNSLNAESYLMYLYLYALTDGNLYKEKAEKNYSQLKSIAENVVNKVNQSKLFNNHFSIDKFMLKNYLENDNLIEILNEIVIF